jgi:hypothetical protein
MESLRSLAAAKDPERQPGITVFNNTQINF